MSGFKDGKCVLMCAMLIPAFLTFSGLFSYKIVIEIFNKGTYLYSCFYKEIYTNVCSGISFVELSWHLTTFPERKGFSLCTAGTHVQGGFGQMMMSMIMIPI